MTVPEIDVHQLADEIAKGSTVIDVRQPDEYAEVHAPGVQLLPLDEVPESLDRVPTGETVYVICRSGGRSLKAAEFFRANGIDAVNVAGGTLAWVDAGFETATGADS